MNNLVKVLTIKEFWYEGKHYVKDEYLYFTQEIIDKIGLEHFEIIKALEHPTNDKMIHSYIKK